MDLETKIGQVLRARGLTVATAESCTGGLIGHRLTEISGSSAYLMGGIIAYSNAAKMQFLGVTEETLQQYGAVSAETAREMAQGAQIRFEVDFALSVTGIAGPTGGTPEKPIGLTYIGLATRRGVEVQKHIWAGNRSQNKYASATAALELLWEALA